MEEQAATATLPLATEGRTTVVVVTIAPWYTCENGLAWKVVTLASGRFGLPPGFEVRRTEAEYRVVT